MTAREGMSRPALTQQLRLPKMKMCRRRGWLYSQVRHHWCCCVYLCGECCCLCLWLTDCLSVVPSALPSPLPLPASPSLSRPPLSLSPPPLSPLTPLPSPPSPLLPPLQSPLSPPLPFFRSLKPGSNRGRCYRWVWRSSLFTAPSSHPV